MPFSTPRSSTSLLRLLACTGLALIITGSCSALATTIAVPNGSFESPAGNTQGFPVSIELDNWTDTAPRADYTSEVPWDFGTGSFFNPAEGGIGRYSNMDGQRAAYILNSLELGFFQELTSPDGVFTIGKSYVLTVGVAAQAGTPGGSQNDSDPYGSVPGSTVLSLSLYYVKNGSITLIPGATTPVPAFPDTNTFVDYSVTTPTVQASDEWAGKHIGILMQITTSIAETPETTETGGFDIDNVRLEQVPEPGSALLALTGVALLSATRHRRRRA